MRAMRFLALSDFMLFVCLEDGFLILERKYESREVLRDKAYEFYKDTIDDPNDPYMDKEYFIKNFPIGYSLDMDMPDTPGYSVGIRHSGDLYDNDTTALLNMDHGPMMQRWKPLVIRMN